jgi:hypothetical protein
MTGEGVFWTTLVASFFGAVVGWHLGLRRAAQAYQEEASLSPVPPNLIPLRERVIIECIQRISALKGGGIYTLREKGIDEAIDILQSIDKRSPQLTDFISRRALDRGKENQ